MSFAGDFFNRLELYGLLISFLAELVESHEVNFLALGGLFQPFFEGYYFGGGCVEV